MLPAGKSIPLWPLRDQSDGTLMLGCGECLERQHCGGLQVAAGGADAMDCMSMCRCDDPDACDVMCPKAPERYVRRWLEVGGLALTDVPVAKPLPFPLLPDEALLVEGKANRARRPSQALSYVAVPLSMTVKKTGLQTRPKSRRELESTFGLAPKFGWIASGVEQDAKVERMWKLPSPKRTYQALRDAGVILATTPDYSTIADVPRPDNLHAMKRIAWTWYEMMDAGLQAALHINGRTDFDYIRWGEFAKRQPALQAVAFEFLTGAEPKESGLRFVARIHRFVEVSGRKNLVLVLRGGAQWVDRLEPYFRQVVLLDSGVYMKTVKRQRMELDSDGNPRYRSNKTSSDAELNELFLHNVRTRLVMKSRRSRPAPTPVSPPSAPAPRAPRVREVDPNQMELAV